MKRLMLLMAGCCVLLLPGMAYSQDHGKTARELLVDCKIAIQLGDRDFSHVTYDELIHLRSCIEYIRGYVEGASVMMIIFNDVRYCVPEGNTIQQFARVFVKYVDQHPEWLHWGADALLNAAMTDAFPCSVLSRSMGGVK